MSISLQVDGESLFVSTENNIFTNQHDDYAHHAFDGFARDGVGVHVVSFQENDGLVTGDNAEVSIDGIAIDPFKHIIMLERVVLERIAFPIDGDDITCKLTLQGATNGGDDVVHCVSRSE